MMEICSAVLNGFKKKRISVLATIIDQKGTSPRGAGAKMMIMDDGGSIGSVGGGILEKAVIEASSRVFSSGLPLIFTSAPEISCGGGVEIFLEPVPPDNDICIRIWTETSDIIKRGGSGLLVTALDTRLWHNRQMPKALFRPSGEITGILPGMDEAVKILMNRLPSLLDMRRPEAVKCKDMEGDEISIFLEPIISDPVLYVFGAGHISYQVIPIARRVGFKTIVVDDRPEFADPLKFPDAETVFNYPYDDVMKLLPIDRSSFIVIATRSHLCDEMVLGQALKTEAGYIGMIGSRRKISTIYNNLLSKGFIDKDFKRVHSPIGIDIGAETPEEIALSIVSELVKERAWHIK